MRGYISKIRIITRNGEKYAIPVGDPEEVEETDKDNLKKLRDLKMKFFGGETGGNLGEKMGETKNLRELTLC